MRQLYTFSIFLYAAIAKCLSLSNKKAKLWVEGRKNLLSNIQSQIKPNEDIIWFHCASLGEFEQGRPLMELFKEKEPTVKILLTFFSPSGYEVRKNHKGADYVFYLPTDTPKHAEHFLDIVNPKCIFFIKYEFWYNYIHQAYKRKIPFYSAACRFNPKMFYFSWYGKWFCRQLAEITHFFTQDENSAHLLHKAGITQTSVCGDTRFDRVYQIVKTSEEIPFFTHYSKNKFTMVAGSTWQPDEEILADLMFKYSFQLIIAPHEIHEEHILSIEKLFSNFSPVRYSQIVKNDMEYAKNKVIIIDAIGLLNFLYRYGNIAYVGGGFGAGIHNILEAAAYGKSIIFGSNYSKFKEAADLIQLQGAFSGGNYTQIEKIFSLLYFDNSFRKESENQALQYVGNNIGATKKIYDLIKQQNVEA